MTEVALRIETHTVDVPPSVRNARSSWRQRQSALIVIEDANGRRGYGEATPLPGYSPDTIESAVASLSGIAAQDLTALVECKNAADTLRGVARQRELPPSACFALGSALLSLRAQRNDSSLRTELSQAAVAFGLHPSDRSNEGSPLARAELLDLEDDLTRQLEAARSRGVHCFKAKVGSMLERERAKLDLVSAALSSTEQLRLDANGTLLDDVALDSLAAFHPEFVEEPFADLGAPRFLSVPLALDETLWRSTHVARAWLDAGRIHSVVIKPMLLGLTRSLEWCQAAREHGSEIVISHCFCGAFANAVYEALAECIATPSVAMGLGLHPGLELWSDVIERLERQT